MLPSLMSVLEETLGGSALVRRGHDTVESVAKNCTTILIQHVFQGLAEECSSY